MNEYQKIICRSCGGENNSANTFCMNCGERITSAPEPTPVVPTDQNNIPRAEGEVVSTPTWYNQENTSNPYQNTGSAYTPPPQYANNTYANSGNQAVNQASNQASNQGLAIASMVCGIVSFVCCLSIIASIPGLILGIISLTKQQGGRGMAIAGVVLCAISIVFSVIYIIFVIILAMSPDYGSYWYDFL